MSVKKKIAAATGILICLIVFAAAGYAAGYWHGVTGKAIFSSSKDKQQSTALEDGEMDEDEIDDKIIAIPCEDPTWNFYTDISQLPPHYGNEITHFFEVYKGLEHKHTATSDALDREGAVGVIADCMRRYEVHFCGMRPEKGNG